MEIVASNLDAIELPTGHVKRGDCVLVDGTELGEFHHARRERGNKVSCVVWTERGGFRALPMTRVSPCEASSGGRRR